MLVTRNKVVIVTLMAALLAVAALAVVQAAGSAERSSRLVAVQHLSPDGDLCAWPSPLPSPLPEGAASEAEDPAVAFRPGRPAAYVAASLQPDSLAASLQRGSLLMALQQGSGAARASGQRALTPLRTIRDTHPTYSAIAVNVNADEVILQDNNLWSYRVFNRLDNTPPGAEMTKPKRVVQGEKTALQFNNGLYVDPNTGDIYSVESDTGDKLVVFPREANGDIAPKRILRAPHRVYNIAVNESTNEMFVTVEYPPEVIVYRKDANGDDKPIRRIQGDKTELDAPHGIAVDEKNQLLYVNTWGHRSNFRIPGSGRFLPPAIKVYALNATGDTPPLREISGESTQLDWPAAMKLNPDTGDLYVANDIGQSILVFKDAANAQGNVAPARVVKGDKTRLRNPTGVFLDRKNRELWVSNLGNASATAYPLMANGDVAPLRVIRSAPEGKRSLNFGRTAAVAYDSTREQLLVPN